MQLMSIEDLAAYLGDSKRTIYKYIATGDCPPYMRISAKNIKFDRADVDAWLKSKKALLIRTRRGKLSSEAVAARSAPSGVVMMFITPVPVQAAYCALTG